MLIWNPKNPDDIVAYTFDWRDDLGDDVIATSVVTVNDGDALIQGTPTYACNVVSLIVSGGTVGVTTTFTNTITTAGGQTLSKAATLIIYAGADVAAPTTATKRLVVGMAYAKCRLGGFEFTTTPDEQQNALLNLDLLMAEWAATGFDLGYNQPTIPGDGNLEDQIGIPNAALNGVSWALALAIAPEFGKTMGAEALKSMASAISAAKGLVVTIPSMQFPRYTAAGAGNRWPLGGVYMWPRRCC